MRAAYREQLDNFAHDLIIMSTAVHRLMTLASQALIESSLQPAEEALSLRDELDEVRSRCEDRAVSLLALENPMAKDLRQVIASIYIVEDFYRMGRLSQHIATSARRRHPESVVPSDIMGYFEEYARLVLDMSLGLKDILITRDPELALRLTEDDDAVDDINQHLLRMLTQREWKGTVRQAVETSQLSRYYERFADHCAAAAGRIIYLATGLDPDRYMRKRDQEQREAELEARMAELERQFHR